MASLAAEAGADKDSVLSKVYGAMLGAVVGDALGAPFEGKSRKQIEKLCGDSGGRPTVYYSYKHMGVSKTEALDRSGHYTDDACSMLAVADSLVQTGGVVDPDHILRAVAIAWRESQSATPRVYPASSERVMSAVLDDGMGALEAGRAEFADGSYANGGASRLVALGLLLGVKDMLLSGAGEWQACC